MIVGTTVSKTGELIQRLPVSTKIAIGLAPSGQRNFPERLDHFLALKRGPDKGSWIVDPEKMNFFAPDCKHEPSDSCAHCCREVKILLLDDELSNVFPHELAMWGRSGKKCWGDGEKALRRKDDVSDPVEWTPCRNNICPEWESGKCAGSGDLRFCLADFPILGSIARIHTSSLKSIENIASALNLIQTFTGGRLAGVTVPLCVTMEPATYIDDGKRKSTVVPILSIKTGVNELVSNIKATMELWGTARKAFGGRIVVDDDETERTAEIPPEFPPKGEQPALPPAETKPPEPETAKPETPKAPTAVPSGGQPEPKKTVIYEHQVERSDPRRHHRLVDGLDRVDGGDRRAAKPCAQLLVGLHDIACQASIHGDGVQRVTARDVDRRAYRRDAVVERLDTVRCGEPAGVDSNRCLRVSL